MTKVVEMPSIISMEEKLDVYRHILQDGLVIKWFKSMEQLQHYERLRDSKEQDRHTLRGLILLQTHE